MRETVFGPLVQRRHARLLQGVRRVEALDPAAAAVLRSTLCGHDRQDAGRALLACVDLYCRWVDEVDQDLRRNRNAETLAVHYLSGVVAQTGEVGAD